MNIVKKRLDKGLADWNKSGFKITHIGRKKYIIPRIEIGNSKNITILFISGLHLEETSGPLLLLSPNKLLNIFDRKNNQNFSFLIYPLVNNYGLGHHQKSDEKLLRYDRNNLNYNDGWGLSDLEKSREVKIVEDDILYNLKSRKIAFAISLHEDSSVPGKGYIWINGMNNKLKRKELIQSVKQKADKESLIHMTQKRAGGGKVEGNIAIVNARDKGTLEDWLAHDLNVPTVLSEAPFSKTLFKRIGFHKLVIKSSISIL